MSTPINRDSGIFTIRLSKGKKRKILKGIKAKMKADKATRNKTVETIFDEYFLFLEHGHDLSVNYDTAKTIKNEQQ